MILDCNATLGQWPFRRLRNCTPTDFAHLMDDNGIAQAWVSPFEGIFYNVTQEANEGLAEELLGLRDRLIQLPVINPAYPGWEDDVEECRELEAPGLRLYPSYHGYRLQDAHFLQLAQRCAELGWFLQIVTRVQDERHQHHLARVQPVPVADIVQVARDFAPLPVMVLNAASGEVLGACEGGCPDNLSCDISHVEGVGGVGDLSDRLGAGHVLFGTHAPLLIPESALLKMREADLNGEDRELIVRGNAIKIVQRS